MFQFIFSASATLLFSISSFASINFDGCYQLYLANSMYPAFCLSGTDGAGARLTLFEANTDLPLACAASSSLKMTANTLTFVVGSFPEVKMTVLQNNSLRLEGTVTFRRTTLNFLQFDSRTTQNLLAKIASEPVCSNLTAGEFARIR